MTNMEETNVVYYINDFFLWNNEWFVIIKILQAKPVKNMLIKLVIRAIYLILLIDEWEY